jgi:NTP pyrophosphatase (non-canonical NTP hydrolase)
MNEITIREVQDRTRQNKLAKSLSADTVFEFALAFGELGEAFDAFRKSPSDLGGELADVLIYLTSIATMNGIDLGEAVRKKLQVNESRTYEMNANGFLVKTVGREGNQ